LFPVAELVFDNPIAFHSADGMFHSDANAGNLAIVFLFFRGEFAPTGFLFRLQNGHAFQGEALKAGVLTENTAFRQSKLGFIGSQNDQNPDHQPGIFTTFFLRSAQLSLLFAAELDSVFVRFASDGTETSFS
jgi:hypothetical protein